VTTLSVAEVLEALANAAAVGERPAHAYSGTDIMQTLRWGHTRFAKQMRVWLAEGTCKVVTYRKDGLDGRVATVKGYQFAEPVAAKRKRK
jgi:hypothetical protein